LNSYLASMTITDTSSIDASLAHAYRGWGFDQLSDVALAHEIGRSISHPRRDPADSFVLHAPLELAARSALLPFVGLEQRDVARLRIFSIAGHFDDFGPPVDEPADVAYGSAGEAAHALAEAIEAGDLDAVDRTARHLGMRVPSRDLLPLLTDTVLPRLSAAAHGSILLYQLPRIAPRGELPTELLRPLARELAREPSWRLTWMEDMTSVAVDTDLRGGEQLFAALGETPHLGVPGSDFIFPVMAQAEQRGVAEDVLSEPLAAVDLTEGARAILRIAAWSMVLEPETYAPYGWTHCLTLPQAVLGVAQHYHDPRAALAVAATYVVGFRAAFATVEVDAGLADPGPETAPECTPETLAGLATRAAAHADAHFVKYTLACIDAASFDPTHARLYMAAAQRLADFWTVR
jgi:hypothetical protein